MREKDNESSSDIVVIRWRWLAISLFSVVGLVVTSAVGLAGAYIKLRSDTWDGTTSVAKDNSNAIGDLKKEFTNGFKGFAEHKRGVESSLASVGTKIDKLADEIKRVGDDVNKNRCYSDRCDEFDRRLRKGGL